MNSTTFKNKYNNSTTGLFKTNTTGDIESIDARALVTDIGDEFLNFDDDVLDEDDFASNSNTQIPTQQSTKAYVDAKVLAGEFWPLSGSATFGGPVTMEGFTDDEGTTIYLRDPSFDYQVIWDIKQNATGDEIVSNTLNLSHPDYDLSSIMRVETSSGALAQLKIKNKLTDGESFIQIGADMNIQLIPSQFESGNGAYAEMNTGITGSGFEDKAFIRLYGSNASNAIHIYGDDDSPIKINRESSISGVDWDFTQSFFANGSNSGILFTGLNGSTNATMVISMDKDSIVIEKTNAAGTDSSRVLFDGDNLSFRKEATGDYVFENAGISVDAALVSTHSMIISNGTNQYKIALTLV